MCAIMLPDGRWTHVPSRSAASGLGSAEGNPSWLRSAEGASRNQLAAAEHPDDTRAVPLIVALDPHREPLLLEQ